MGKFSPPKGKPYDNFEISDQVGLRQSVIPLLSIDNSKGVSGLGTSFRMDGVNGLITAEHIVDVAKFEFQSNEITDDGTYLDRFFPQSAIYAMLWFDGILFGTGHLPSNCLQRIVRLDAPLVPASNPIEHLRGVTRFKAEADIALLTTETPLEKRFNDKPLIASRLRPNLGEWVCAAGFPNINILNNVKIEMIEILVREEKICLAFGQITEIHWAGRRGFSTPIIEVRANWPSGMSGGPVLNLNGEVVGIVSTSVEAKQNCDAGIGFATIFPC